MPTAKPVKVDASTQSSVAYKANLDANSNVDARISWAWAPHAQDTPNMTVRLEAGAILSGVTLTEVAAQNTGTITAPSTHPRIDRVVIDRVTGAASVVEGSEAASPTAPAIPAGKLPVAQVLLTVGMTAITNADLTDERVGGGSVAIAQDLSSPSETEVPSTQALQNALDAFPTTDADARALAMFNSFIAQIHAGRASGPIPSGYMHLFLTDELATKTGATYDSASDYYGNAGSISATKATITSGMVTLTGFNSPSTSAIVDGSTSGSNNDPVNGTTAGNLKVKIDFGAGNEQNIGQVKFYVGTSGSGPATKIQYSDDNVTLYDAGGTAAAISSTGWQTLTNGNNGAHRYWYIVNTSTCPSSGYWTELEMYPLEAVTNMTLIPTAITAGSAPGTVDFYMLHKSVDSVTLNTDLKARVSRDNGSNWSAYVTLAEVCQFDANYKLLKGTADLSALASGTSVKWEVTTYNTKAQQVRATSMLLAA